MHPFPIYSTGLINVMEFFETWQQPTAAALAVKWSTRSGSAQSSDLVSSGSVRAVVALTAGRHNVLDVESLIDDDEPVVYNTHAAGLVWCRMSGNDNELVLYATNTAGSCSSFGGSG